MNDPENWEELQAKEELFARIERLTDEIRRATRQAEWWAKFHRLDVAAVREYREVCELETWWTDHGGTA